MPSLPTLLLAIAGLIFLAVGWRIRRADIASASWLPVSATILSSDIAPQEGGFAPSVSYRYAIAGETYVSTDIALAIVSSSSDASARTAAARYSVGTPVIAYVNPRNPRQAILEPRSHALLPVALLAAGLLLLAMSIYRLLAGLSTSP